MVVSFCVIAKYFMLLPMGGGDIGFGLSNVISLCSGRISVKIAANIHVNENNWKGVKARSHKSTSLGLHLLGL